MEEGRTEGRMALLYSLATDGVITVSEAAKRAQMSESEFVEKMKGKSFSGN